LAATQQAADKAAAAAQGKIDFLLTNTLYSECGVDCHFAFWDAI
jgi:hypothetical protein